MNNRATGFESISVKDTEQNENVRSHSLPIYASSAFEFESLEHGISIFTGETNGYVYGRYGNPTLDAVANKIALLEGYGTGVEPVAFLTPSGMSAIYLAVNASVSPGQTLLAQYNLYGGTTELLQKVVSGQGREVVFTDLRDAERLRRDLSTNNKVAAIYLETPSNPDLRCVDILQVTEIAGEFGVKTILDNTFATPYLQRGFGLDVDIVIHSTTKYLNGNGNIIGGVILGKDAEFMNSRVKDQLKLMGAMASPFDSWILNNGMKTLALRMERHCDNAEKIATVLDAHEKVSKVNYPGLTDHPDHKVAAKQMARFGGMLSFELAGGLEAGKKFMAGIEFCSLAPTLGNVDTLILHPASMSHLKVPKEIREKIGITDGLVRLSVGIETAEDIIKDLVGALDRI